MCRGNWSVGGLIRQLVATGFAVSHCQICESLATALRTGTPQEGLIVHMQGLCQGGASLHSRLQLSLQKSQSVHAGCIKKE